MRSRGESLGVIVVPTGCDEDGEGNGRSTEDGTQGALLSGRSGDALALAVRCDGALQGAHSPRRLLLLGKRPRSPARDTSFVTVPLLRSAPPSASPGSPQLPPVPFSPVTPEAGAAPTRPEARSSATISDLSGRDAASPSGVSVSVGATTASGGTLPRPSSLGRAAQRPQPPNGRSHGQLLLGLSGAGAELPGMVPQGGSAATPSLAKSDDGDLASPVPSLSCERSQGKHPAEANTTTDTAESKSSLNPAERSTGAPLQPVQNTLAQSAVGPKDVPGNGCPADLAAALPFGDSATPAVEAGASSRFGEASESLREGGTPGLNLEPYSFAPPQEDDQGAADQAQQESEDDADGRINSLDKLETVRYIKRPLGTFEKTLTYMKHREFIRKHHGVFGTTSLSSCIWWALGCQFLVMSVGMMTCERVDEEGPKYVRSFLDPKEVGGKLSIYFFSSLALTLILAIRFGGPLMLKWSARLSKLGCTMLLITAPAVQIRESLEGSVICATALYVAPLRLNGMVIFNGIFTQLQLLMFIGSMLNSLLWAKMHAFWFSHRSVKLWNVVKKQTIRLQIPQPIEHSLARDRQPGGERRIINADGLYIELHGFSFSNWFHHNLARFLPAKLVPSVVKPAVSVVFYVGQVDKDELPHGFGRWRSEAYHGESLVGYWDHGIPVGPFKSREFGTGSGFMCIRIGWCKVTKGVLRPDIQLGVGDAECCVSGAFFRTFPRVTLYPLRDEETDRAFAKRLPSRVLNELIANDKGATVGRLSLFTYKPADADGDVARRPSWLASQASSGDDIDDHEHPNSEGARSVVFSDRVQRIRGSMIMRAQMLFKRRTDRAAGESRAKFLQECQRMCLARMVPHLPNFGVPFTTEVHITVDRERGLYIGGWIPVNALIPLEPSKGPALKNMLPVCRGESFGLAQNGAPCVRHLTDEDEGAGLADQEAREKLKQRKLSESQMKGRGLHQRFGLALHQPERMMKRRGPQGEAEQRRLLEDFFFERPRIRRRTYDDESKCLIVRTVDKRKRRQLRATSMFAGRPNSSSSRKDIRPRRKSSSAAPLASNSSSPDDPLAPDDDPIKGFDWINNAPELQIDGWQRAEVMGIPEALIFIHGYNTNHVQSLQIMAQMLSFGNFPSYIKPFLFTWPAGRNFAEFFEARENANNPRIQDCFRDFILSLRDNGIRQIHIMAHSLGSRLLMNSLHRFAEDIFNKSLDLDGTDQLGLGASRDKMHLVTLIFLNPEFFLDDFVRHEYSFLRQYCSNISLFCDAHDGALWWSELFSGRQALGRSVFGLYTRPKGSGSDTGSDVARKLPPVYAETMACFQGYEPDYLKSDTREWLDLDVIDMTWLGNNVHAMRHSYWPLNREIIEDIRELVVTRKRARQRTSRLDRREGNVWVYRVAPSSLTSIFDSDI
ncbi:transmembrane [Cystoisospora suis]|uniref:Transmembrane n=1 Tax=Cystoisospora suis TaxID=483139 RepID=A0A2C6KYF3_9APIC|nr:transmembrane [Cystoisospora suis]